MAPYKPLIFLALGVAACTSHTGPSKISKASSRPSPIRVALSAAPRTLAAEGGSADDRAKERLASSLSRATGNHVIVIHRSGATDVANIELEAAEQRADAMLSINHASGSPDGFIVAMLRVLETDELIGETAEARGDASEVLEALKSWYLEMTPALDKIPSFSYLNFLKRLEKEGHCPEVAAFLSGHEFQRTADQKEADALSERCALQISRADVASGMPLHIRTENMTDRQQSTVGDRAKNSGLINLLQLRYREMGDLWIRCENDCSRGRIRLTLPYDRSWYREQKAKPDRPLQPYEPLARAILEFRSELKGLASMSEFLPEIFITSEASNLAIDVSGSATQPKLTPKSEPSNFFGSEL